MLGPGMIILLL